MAPALDAFHERLRARFGDQLGATKLAVGQITLEVPAVHLIAVCTALRDEAEFRFTTLVDVCGMDYQAWGQSDWETQDTTSTGFSRGVSRGTQGGTPVMPARFAAVYQLLSMEHNLRLRLRCFAGVDPPRLPSVVDVWAAANWYEREAFDLFGILFEGHPDLRRLLTDYGFIGHPFRKDFPLEGNVEVRYDPDQKRVIYQPVTIKNRVLVPRVIRHDNRYETSEK